MRMDGDERTKETCWREIYYYWEKLNNEFVGQFLEFAELKCDFSQLITFVFKRILNQI